MVLWTVGCPHYVDHTWLAQYFQLFISCYCLIQEENLLKRITGKTKYFKIDHLIADVYLTKPSLGYFGNLVNLEVADLGRGISGLQKQSNLNQDLRNQDKLQGGAKSQSLFLTQL